MIRNLKILGLALVAISAMSAMAASAASAQTPSKLTAAEPFTLIGHEDGLNEFTGFAGKVRCANHTVTGHKTTKTSETGTHQLIPSGSSSVTVTAHYGTVCEITDEGAGAHKATVTMNGCDYDLTVGETVTGTYPITADLVCPTGKDVEIDVYPFAGSELGGVACKITIKPQTGLKGVHVSNGGGVPDDLTLTGTFTGIHSEQSGFGCETHTSTTDELHVNYTVKAYNEAGKQINVTVTD
jgi:hypothetical protein